MKCLLTSGAAICLASLTLASCTVQPQPLPPKLQTGSHKPARVFPDSSTTGVPEGTELTEYTGPCSIDTPDTKIDAKIINCDVRVLADDIVITRSIIHGTLHTDLNYSPGRFSITDSEIRAPAESGTGIGEGNFTARRVEVTGGGRSVNCASNCTIEDSYLHGQYTDLEGRDHESGIRMGSNSIIRNNTISCDAEAVPPNGGCSAGLTGYGDFGIVQNNIIDGNLFMADSGGYCAYGGSTKGKPFSEGVNNIRFTNNVWQRGQSGQCGIYGPITAFDPAAPGNVWVNNMWDDGTPVGPAG